MEIAQNMEFKIDLLDFFVQITLYSDSESEF